MVRRSACGEKANDETGTAAVSEDELVRRATADRAAGRDGTSDVEGLLLVAAEQNQAALDRLAR
jgi:hypothetical protein